MKYLSFILLIVGSVFLGCGSGTDIEARATSVSATTADGSSYNFSGNIIAQWESYSLRDSDTIEVKNVRVLVDGTDYPSTWTWSRKIEDLREADVRDEETSIPFNFLIKLPESSHSRNCVLKYTLSLDGDNKEETVGCILPTK